MKKYNKNKRTTFSVIVVLLVILLGIGYAALTTALKIEGHVAIGEISFDIHFDHVATAQHKATVNTEAYIVDETTKKEISFDVSLAKLNDYYAFTTDIVNDGSIPGKIKSIELNGLNDSQRRLLKFKAKYTTSNKTVAVGDYIGPESSKNITVELLYELSDDVTDEDLAAGAQELDCTFIIRFENGDMTEYLSRAASNRLMQDTEFFPTSFVNFTKATNSDEHLGVYRLDGTENDDFPIYFYRGDNAHINNHLNFGGYCWRILRTTNTGGIKLIYNGVPNSNGQCTNLTGTDTQLTSHIFNQNTSTSTKNGYVGSDLQYYLNTWYFEHLINYQAYLEDTEFCVDNDYENGNISLTCSESGKVSMANHKNNYPIGLLSAYEGNLLGFRENQTGLYDLYGDYEYDSQFPWLYTGYSYWTLSPNTNNRVWMIVATGSVSFGNPGGSGEAYQWGDYTRSFGVRPVVSLNSEVVISGGEGTTTNPYTVSLG